MHTSMHSSPLSIPLILCLATQAAPAAEGAGETNLLLIPYPKQVARRPGDFQLRDGLEARLSRSDDPDDRRSLALLVEEIQGDLSLHPRVVVSPRAPSEGHGLFLGAEVSLPAARHEKALGPEGYVLIVDPEGARLHSTTSRGLFYGVQTLRQIVRANARGASIPCVEIEDWPGFPLRAYSDDITRGPSPTLEFLLREITLAASFKMNGFSYYLEDQFFHEKHPDIGPEGGRLLPAELKECVRHARSLHVDVIGNQQSFGHFSKILSVPAYRHLAETPDVLCPAIEESYKLLEDLYASQVACLESKLFNVCCDEVFGLGSGPARKIVEELGPGRVYAGHMRRVHDLVHGKFGKQMLMWGDIALSDPVIQKELPRDITVVNWAYDDRPSFEGQIKPFVDAGYSYLVAPGISCWSRILPDFSVATANIFNFCRDGAKHGAIGVLNTTWDDDGENLFNYNWHGILWGAECSWNPGTADLKHFNDSFGPVFFGTASSVTKGGDAGKAVSLLAKAHRLPGYDAMLDPVFWRDFGRSTAAALGLSGSARRLAKFTKEAIGLLSFARGEARFSEGALDALLFGARRMAHVAKRDEALASIARDPAVSLKRAAETFGALAQDLEGLRGEYKRLYLLENRPYFLDRNLALYGALLERYRSAEEKLREAAVKVPPGGAAPSPAEVLGLATLEGSLRAAAPRPPRQEDEFKLPREWTVPGASLRIPIAVGAGDLPREDLPVEVTLDAKLLRSAPAEDWKSLTAVEVDADGKTLRALPAQLLEAQGVLKPSVAWTIPGRIETRASRSFVLYVGGKGAGRAGGSDVRVKQDGESWWAESEALRILIGPEGAHIYRWHVKALGDLEITEAGDEGWHGFSDLGSPLREARHEIRCVAAGPVVARFACLLDGILAKLITVPAGASWVEVNLASGAGYYWDFDRTSNFAADSPQPGTAIFSTGKAEAVPRSSELVQVAADGALWGAKYRADGLTLALLLPAGPSTIRVGPGGGWGGCGIERVAPASSFITFAGKCPAVPPGEFLSRLHDTLSLKERARVVIFPAERAPER